MGQNEKAVSFKQLAQLTEKFVDVVLINKVKIATKV